MGIPNFSMLVSHVRVPPALDALLSSPEVEVQGFLLAGHVCAVMGYWEYPPLVEQYHVPMVVTGFEPLDVVQGILMPIRQLEAGSRGGRKRLQPRRRRGRAISRRDEDHQRRV